MVLTVRYPSLGDYADITGTRRNCVDVLWVTAPRGQIGKATYTIMRMIEIPRLILRISPRVKSLTRGTPDSSSSVAPIPRSSDAKNAVGSIVARTLVGYVNLMSSGVSNDYSPNEK